MDALDTLSITFDKPTPSAPTAPIAPIAPIAPTAPIATPDLPNLPIAFTTMTPFNIESTIGDDTMSIIFQPRHPDSRQSPTLTLPKRQRIGPSPPPFDPPFDPLPMPLISTLQMPPPLQPPPKLPPPLPKSETSLNWKDEKHWGLMREHGGIKAYLKQQKEEANARRS